MWRSPLHKGILGDPHLTHMIDSSVLSNRDLLRSEIVRPSKLNTRSTVALDAGIAKLCRKYDPAQQTTTIRHHTKFQCDLNTRKERSLLVATSVCSLVWVNVFPTFFDLPISSQVIFFCGFFFYEFATNTSESSMSDTPSLQISCLP